MSYPVQECRMEDLRPLTSQVAGHGSAGSRSRSGMYVHTDGYVIKPVEKEAIFEKERQAYDYINQNNDPLTMELRNFLPNYHGVRKLRLEGRELKALALQNLTLGMSKPCVLDIKIGRQTWEPNAPQEKINIEKGKYIKCRRELGFCIPGVMYYKDSNIESPVEKHGREHGKRLDKDGAIDVIRAFVDWDPQLSRILILQYLVQLQDIFEWFQNQDQYQFFSSSLLFVYDAEELSFLKLMMEDTELNSIRYSGKLCTQLERWLSFYIFFKGEDDLERRKEYLKKASRCLEYPTLSTRASVKIIDLAHLVIKNDKNLDSNYLEGVTKLIDIFEKMLEDLRKSLPYLPG